MSERDRTHEVLALRTKESPSGDIISTFLSRDSGLLETFVFGGPKSSLRAYAAPYTHGTAFVYTDPVKNFKKLSDMVVDEPFQGLRESYPRAWAASALAEFVIRTAACGGEYETVFFLTLEALRVIERADEGAAKACLLAALWKLIDVMGVKPDTGVCSRCGSALPAKPGIGAPFSPSAYLLRGGEGFICASCASRAEEGARASIPVSAEALSWLADASGRSLGEASENMPADPRSVENLVFALARLAAEGPLFSLEYGI